MTSLERAAVCTLDCPDTCSLTVTVDDGRIVKVRGSDALPYTEGIICNKVARHTGDFVHGYWRNCLNHDRDPAKSQLHNLGRHHNDSQ